MDLYKTILLIHIIAGTIGLLSGTVNIIRKKGDKFHRFIGKFFFYSMLTVGFSAFALSILHPNYFLFIVGVFTVYMVSTGFRYLALKELASNQKVKPIDWILTILMLLFGLLFVGFGIFILLTRQSFGIVFMVFGFIALLMVKADIKNYNGKTEFKNAWLLVHLQRMTGAYIAALTAFLVVNFPGGILPNYLFFVPWLLPTAILTPLIFKWSKKHLVKRK